MQPEVNWLTVDEAAKRLKVSTQTIRRALKSGKLKGIKPFGNRSGWRIREDDVESLFEGKEKIPAA